MQNLFEKREFSSVLRFRILETFLRNFSTRFLPVDKIKGSLNDATMTMTMMTTLYQHHHYHSFCLYSYSFHLIVFHLYPPLLRVPSLSSTASLLNIMRRSRSGGIGVSIARSPWNDLRMHTAAATHSSKIPCVSLLFPSAELVLLKEHAFQHLKRRFCVSIGCNLIASLPL
jgi:hypothetical protein